jgi:hypothetical protein
VELSSAFYIKLGRGGEWEAESIASGKLRFGWREQSTSDINRGNWQVIEQQLRETRSLPSASQKTSAGRRKFSAVLSP